MPSPVREAPQPVDAAEDLTAEWLTAALRSWGHDLEAVAVETEPIGVGQIGTNLRVRVTWAGTPGPDTLVVKLAAGDPGGRDVVRMAYQKEVGFYTDLAADVAVRAPTCWFGAISTDGTVFSLVLDDLAPAVVGDQLAGCDQAAAHRAIVNVADLHASRWCDPDLATIEWLVGGGFDDTAFLGQVMLTAVPMFAERLASLLDPDDLAVLQQAAEATPAWFETRTERFALVHGDYRLDNLLFAPTGEVSAVDWQTLSVAPPARDLAYFLETSLATDDRRAAEETLVDAYVTALRDRGITDYGRDDVWTDYRLGTLQGPLVTVLGCVFAQAERNERADAMFAVMAKRSCAAIRDLDPFALLP